MTTRFENSNHHPRLLDVVALLKDFRDHGLVRGQVATVVEELVDDRVLLEFSDDEGKAYATAACPRSDLLVLHYVPRAA